MASRSRKWYVRYGGEFAGSSNTGDKNVPAFNCVHSCSDETHPGPPYRTGGPLSVVKKQVFIHRGMPFDAFYNVSLGFYNGFMWVPPYIPSVEPTPISLAGWGAKGWARTQPLHPVYQLGVSLIELKDLPRMVTQTKAGFAALMKLPSFAAKGFKTVREFLLFAAKAPKQVGDAYLYGQFGLYPMIQDLLFLTEMQAKLDKKIAWLTKHNGKAIRRKIELDSGGFSENIARSLAPTSSMGPVLSSFLYAGGQSTATQFPVLKTYQRRIWYSAKYRYYIPELADGRIPKSLKFDLLGLAPDPVVLYKATPWSWLLDWFTSVGDAISNIYARVKYHVIAEYAYVMCSEYFTYKCFGKVITHSGTRIAGIWDGPDKTHSGISSTEYKFRKREAANPYGFGITFSSLSTYQWSILAALGLSRAFSQRS